MFTYIRIVAFLILLTIFLPSLSYASKSEWDGLYQLTDRSAGLSSIQMEKEVSSLLDSASEEVTNRELIDLLNNSDFAVRAFSFRTDANIFLGRWVLRYEPEKIELIRKFDQLDSLDVDYEKEMYRLGEKKLVQGALIKKHSLTDAVKQVMKDDLSQVIGMPLSFQVAFPKEITVATYDGMEDGERYGIYVPAIETEGLVVYADVYLKMKGKNRQLMFTNKLAEKAGAWLPIENHFVMEKEEM